jgi:hypothetical protein
VWSALRSGDETAVCFAALTCGFLAAAFVASPTDGHWELGLLPALAVLSMPSAQRRRGRSGRPIGQGRTLRPVAVARIGSPELTGAAT